MNYNIKGGVVPVVISGAMYLGHVLVSLIHSSQITGHDILEVYDKVDNNLASSEAAYNVQYELDRQTLVNIKQNVNKLKRDKLKEEIRKIKANKEIANIKKELERPLNELIKNRELEDNLLHHNYKKRVNLTDEDEDLYAKSIFSEKLLDKISLDIDEVVNMIEGVSKSKLNSQQKRILKIIQNFVYLYRHFKDNRSHFGYDEHGKRVFIVEGKYKSNSATKSKTKSKSHKSHAKTKSKSKSHSTTTKKTKKMMKPHARSLSNRRIGNKPVVINTI